MNSPVAHWQWAVDTVYVSVFGDVVTGSSGYRLSRSSSPLLSGPERDSRESETGFWRNSWIFIFIFPRVFLVLFLLDFISGDF
jgi:hypothetical protein